LSELELCGWHIHGVVWLEYHLDLWPGVTPLRKDDGFLYSDTETKAEILNDQFHSIYTREDMTSMPENGQSPYPDMPDIHIGEAGVLKLLNNITSHKATGPDGIPARLLHEYANHIAPALTNIFQISVGTFGSEAVLFGTQDVVSVVMIHHLTMDDML
jgi:hypothetical protein